MNERKQKKSLTVAKRIQRSFGNQLFILALFCDLIAVSLATVAWCYQAERDYSGLEKPAELMQGVSREFQRLPDAAGTKQTTYVVSMEGRQSGYYPMGNFLSLTFALTGAALILELLLIGILDLISAAQVRSQLKPLRQLAEEAIRLSRTPLDATRPPESRGKNKPTYEKFHTLEDAIGHIRPDAPEQRLSTGDRDLAGIETSINDLLARMQASYQQQTRFVSDASHELRTPIAVIKGYADMLARWGKDDVTVLDEGITAIQSETEHMSRLVEQLLFLARGDSGRTHLHFERLDLKLLLNEVYEESRMIHPGHKWSLAAPDPVLVQADAAMLKQAVRILIDNAVKYTSPGNEIRLRAYLTQGGEACMEVQDSGTGIIAEDLSHVFERFFRSDPSRAEKTGGTGLGLAIAKWIVDRHEGFFNITSVPEVGTRICILLPQSINAGNNAPQSHLESGI